MVGLLAVIGWTAAGTAAAADTTMVWQVTLTIPVLNKAALGTLTTTVDQSTGQSIWSFQGTVDGQLARASGVGTVSGSGSTASVTVTRIDAWQMPGVPRPDLPATATIRSVDHIAYVTSGPVISAPVAIWPPLAFPLQPGLYTVTTPGSGQQELQRLPNVGGDTALVAVRQVPRVAIVVAVALVLVPILVIMRMTAPTRRRWGRRLAIGLPSAIGGVVLLVVAVNGYLQLSEVRDPSGRVYFYRNGQRQYLEQPRTIVTPPPLTPRPGMTLPPPTPQPGILPQPEVPRPGVPEAATATAAATDVDQTPLPPLQLLIPAIGVDTPVVLSDTEHIPQIPAVGWLFQSAFPATAGNMVLLGHQDGQAATFGRLHELREGDEIRVVNGAWVHIYAVDSREVVDETAVEVMGPTETSVATLITCAGEWNPATGSYSKRLVVRAHYAAVEAR